MTTLVPILPSLTLLDNLSFVQVYVIMARFNSGKALPCCWALLPNKSEDTYQLMWDAVIRKVNKDGAENHKPMLISVDFEAAVLKILRNRFEGVKIVGCMFHQRQAIWKKIQDLGLSTLFYRDGDFQEMVHMVYALSYVPEDKIVEYYESIVLQRIEEKLSQDPSEDREENDESTWLYWREEITALAAYLDYTWIGRRGARSGRRGRPLFAHELWNQFDVLVVGDGDSGSDQERSICSTNNCLESYNRTMKLLLGNSPNLWRFIQSLISQEAESRCTLVNNAAGIDLSVNQGRNQRVKDHYTRINSVLQRRDDLSPWMYLQTLAKLISEKN
jgi:hypothetical protein